MKAQKTVDSAIETYGSHVFIYSLLFLHLAYVGSFFNLMTFDANFLNNVNIGVQSFICFVLFFRYNPWRKVVLNDNDRNIIFGSAVFLFSNLAITQYIESYVSNLYKNNTPPTTKAAAIAL